MCGIVGIYAFDHLREEYLDKLDAAVDTLSSRGPDARGVWKDQRAALGHRRLSIIDTSTRGNQPMRDETGTFTLVYNGELYNYKDIRKELQTKGHLFQSETDTEVVLKAFMEWGPDCLQRFNGFFAFAIYDSRSNDLFLARDRFGIKPLVFHQNKDHFFFASELKALHAFGVCRTIDLQGLNLYFQLSYIPHPYTIYEHVHKLEPGCYLTISNGQVKKQTYYEVKMQPTLITGLAQAKQAVRAVLSRSVVDRLVADVPLGGFLSGGIDSSVVSALAAREVNGFNTFSIGFKENPFFDETRFAEQVAKQYQTHHHTFRLSNDDLYDHLHATVDYLDEPFGDSSALPVYILSRLTRDHVTVALSGDGADEIFSGYNKHEAWMLARSRSLTNGLIRILHPLIRLLPQSRENKMANFTRQFNRYHQVLGMSYEDRYWWLASFGSEDFRRETLDQEKYLDLQNTVGDLLGDGWDGDLNRMLRQDAAMVLPGDMLRKVDAMSMAHGLEVRVPFLDHRVVETSFSLSEHLKVHKGIRKYILREAFKDELPKDIYQRGKKGFEVPLMQWFRGELSGELEDTVFNETLIMDQGIFNWEGIRQLKQRLHSRNPGEAVTHTWMMYVFQRWYKNGPIH
jgi:asparagine synthase (glutamine-hydrolysing)